MKSHSLEYFHAKINKTIELAQAYTEIPELGFIIRACRLKPHAHIFEGYRGRTQLQNWWFDEFGNSLEITKRKKIKITYNDLRLDRKLITSTDLYYGLSTGRVASISKLLCLCAGRDEDLNQDCFLLTFWGIDHYLRSHLYWYGEWQTVSPLLLGMDYLKLLADDRDIRYSKQLKDAAPLPCVEGKTWLGYLPADQNFLDLIKGQYPALSPLVK